MEEYVKRMRRESNMMTRLCSTRELSEGGREGGREG